MMSMICSLRYLLKMSTETWQAFLMVVISDSSLAAMHKARAAETSLLVNLAPVKDSLSEKNQKHQQQAQNIKQVAEGNNKIFSKLPIEKPNDHVLDSRVWVAVVNLRFLKIDY